MSPFPPTTIQVSHHHDIHIFGHFTWWLAQVFLLFSGLFTPVRKPTVFHQYGFIICQIHCSHYMGWRRKKMGSLDLNVVSCFAKSYFTQIEFAVWGEVKVQPICERQAEEQVTGRRHSAGRWFLGVCTRARHSNGESDNLSRNWSWLRTHNNYVNESKMQERSLFSWQIGTCWSDLY